MDILSSSWLSICWRAVSKSWSFIYESWFPKLSNLQTNGNITISFGILLKFKLVFIATTLLVSTDHSQTSGTYFYVIWVSQIVSIIMVLGPFPNSCILRGVSVTWAWHYVYMRHVWRNRAILLRKHSLCFSIYINVAPHPHGNPALRDPNATFCKPS